MNKDKQIAKIRERMGLTQSELADLVGVSENTIANWEKGGASKWINNLSKLCQVLNCSLNDLVSNDHLNDNPLPELTPSIFDTVKSYCLAVLNQDKKEATKISSFASLHDKKLRYWLDQVHQIIEQYQREIKDEIDYETVINTLVLQNLSLQLSYTFPSQVQFDSFCNLVKQFNLTNNFLERYISFNHESFVRKLIFKTQYLAVYVIGWEPGQIAEMHHHGTYLDAMWVIKGDIQHCLVSPEECSKKKIPFENFLYKGKKYSGKSQTFSTGDWIFINRFHAHQIENLSNQNVATLHIRFGALPEDDRWEKHQEESFTIQHKMQ